MLKKNHILIKIEKYMKQYLIFSVFLFLILNSSAQQIPHYTQYVYNMQILNPAFVGAKADLSISLLSRQQWVGLEGAPKTQTFSINGRTAKGLGIGAIVVRDKIGFSETTNINLDASYTIITSIYSRLAFGLKGGFLIFNNNLSNAITPDNDIYNSTNGNFLNIGMGALFYSQKFYVGLSIPYLFETPQFYGLETDEKNNIASNANYFLSTGASFELNDNLNFRPSTILKYASNLPVSIDFNTSFQYKKIIETGISYRYENSISALFAVVFKEKFRVGYTYDYKVAEYGINLSSHELILNIDLNLNRSSRWLPYSSCYF